MNVRKMGCENGLDLSGSGYGPVRGCCGCGYKSLGSIIVEKFVSS
jgi:hypothetical protein